MHQADYHFTSIDNFSYVNHGVNVFESRIRNEEEDHSLNVKRARWV